MSQSKGASSIPAKYRNPVIHDPNASSYPGDYKITDAALKNYGISRELFGTTEIINPDKSTYIVKDYQYVLEDGSVGMTFLPVNDQGPVPGPDGVSIYGSTLVDEFLREKMNLEPTDPIYAPIYYIHPEQNSGTLVELVNPEKFDKVELGITHWGSYMGNGRTSNSPPLYHNRVWTVRPEPDTNYGYPANVMIMSLDGVDQAVLNRNMVLADDFLNYGVRFPQDYKSSKFRTADLNSVFMFYRDWIMEANYLKTDVTWFTFCAAHKTLVATIGMNLPHNPAAFKEVYGDVEGQVFFDAFCKNHFTLLGSVFTEDMYTDFEPLWKKHGLTPEQIKPFTVDEYYAYDQARRDGKLKDFTGFKPLAPGVGMPWGPQMASDIIYDFVQMYGDFVDAGAITMSITIMLFAGPAAERTGISQLGYLRAALPVVQHAMEAHARINAAEHPGDSWNGNPYYNEIFMAIYGAVGGTDKNINPAAEPDFAEIFTDIFSGGETLPMQLLPELLAWFSLLRVRQNWKTIMAGGKVSLEKAYVDFMDAIQGEIAKAREMVVTRPDLIQYNTPPALAHMIGVGMFEKSEHVSLKTVVTVMNYDELERVEGST